MQSFDQSTELQFGYAVLERGKLVIASTSETANLAKIHWLSFHSGDFELDDFFFERDGKLSTDSDKVFAHYSDCQVVRVFIGIDRGLEEVKH